ncbi:MAG: TonB-dependent receptor [Proteobacteria bacterium]|nr:TonB-dependent receptor [Pseudomonadota bacterium]
MSKKMTLGLVASCSLLSIGALAAESDTAPASSGALEEITVTAQRVEQNLQTTPVAVTALTGAFLQKFDLNRVTSLEEAAPNLNFNSGTGGSSTQVSAFIRGIGQYDFLLTLDPAVGLYVDGVYLARTFGTNLELNDIERTEVLRGPQGTLFGKNNIGGAINITTRTPTGSGRTDLRASVGNFESYALDLYTDLRLTDQLALGVSLMGRRSDGWQDRPLDRNGGKENRYGGRFTLSWSASDTFTSRLSAEFSAQAQPSSPNVMIKYDPSQLVAPFLPLFNAFVSPANPCCTPPTNIDRSGAQGPLVRDDLHGQGLTWINDWRLAGDVHLKSISAYRYMHAQFGRDGDNSALNYSGDVHDEHDTQLSQELQASGAWDRVKWVGGLYYLQERTRDQTQLVTAQGLFQALSALAPIINLANPNDPLTQLYLFRYALDFNLDFDNRQRTRDYAAYLNGEYAFNDRLSLQAGGRYTDESKDFSQFVQNDAGTSIFLPVNPITGVTDTSDPTVPSPACSSLQDVGRLFSCRTSSREFSPRLSLNMKWSDDLFQYLQWSRGFRSGGLSGRPTNKAQIQDYKPEHLDSTELGFKALLAQRRVRLNTALFYDKYKDIQVTLSQGTTVLITNAARATVYGVESDLEAALTDRWTLQGSLGYLHNQYDEWHDTLGDYTNRKLQNAPQWTANLASSYDWRIANGAGIRARANVAFQSWMYLDAQNSPVLRSPSRTLLDAGLFYLAPGDTWELGVEGKNLTDRRVLTSGFNALQFFGYAEGTYNPPRRWWLTFRYHLN